MRKKNAIQNIVNINSHDLIVLYFDLLIKPDGQIKHMYFKPYST